MMEFFFINPSKFELTNYTYEDFDKISRQFGYLEERNPDLHNYFDWSRVDHWCFYYDPYSDIELSELFGLTAVVKERISFLIRLTHRQPLIKVASIDLKDMLEDLSYETGMGWEAISVCGKYILEFTDSYQSMAKSNFEIPAATSTYIKGTDK